MSWLHAQTSAQPSLPCIPVLGLLGMGNPQALYKDKAQ